MRLGDYSPPRIRPLADRSCAVIPSEMPVRLAPSDLAIEAWSTEANLRDQRVCKRSFSRGCGIRMRARKIAGLVAILSVVPIANCFAASAGPAAGFSFYRDTLAFANTTVFAYEQGKIVSHRNFFERKKPDRYTRRCFVMSRTVEQFYKFAQFDPNSPSLDESELHKRIRAVTRKQPWHDPLPPEKRIVIPGYRNLREMSQAHTRLMQRNIGLGWVAYLRPGNFRMFYLHNKDYQEKTHEELEQTLARGEFFIAYLSDYPILHINHSVLVYTHDGKRSADGTDHYLVYDPNHSDAPRHLTWLPAKREFSYEKDQEFVGGFARVFHVYGKFLQ
jgi:hypothetical protein